MCLLRPFTSRHTNRQCTWVGGYVVPLMLLFVACATPNPATLNNMWRDSQYTGQFKNALVVVMKGDPPLRRVWEDAFVNALSKHSVKATPSYRLYPNAVPDTLQIAEAEQSGNFEAIIITHQAPSESVTKYTRGYSTVMPVTYRNPYNGWYYRYYQEVYRPGTQYKQSVVRYETNVWSGSPRTLVWSGTGRVVDPQSSSQTSDDIANVVVPELASQRLIAGK